ncbi:hypothetical protein Tco_0321389 [Tanacetum coccineum]
MVKEISLPHDVPNAFDRRLIELENQVQRLMEAHLAPKPSVQVNKIPSSCEICSGPLDTQYCMENPEQALLIMHPRVPTKREVINDRMTGALPSHTVKNPKLNVNLTSSVSSARTYPKKDPPKLMSSPQFVRADGVAGIKRRRRDLFSDGVRNFATASGRGRLKEDLESST